MKYLKIGSSLETEEGTMADKILFVSGSGDVRVVNELLDAGWTVKGVYANGPLTNYTPSGGWLVVLTNGKTAGA
jgi:hypothetical protein